MAGRGRREGGRIGGPTSVTDLAATELRARVLTGRLALGQHLVEQAVADDVGVSRAALREALRVLERDGLVEHVPRAGWRVVTLTLRDAHEIVVLREHLEELAVEAGVPARPAPLARLDAAVRRMEAAADAADGAPAALDGLAFHRAFIGLPDNRRLTAAFETIAHPLGVLMNLNRGAHEETETLHELAARHRRLCDLVAAGEPGEVRRELRAHPTTAFLGRAELSADGAGPEALAWAAERMGR
ncbi:GntR family transcriptional regulator [Actinosynnema mirum]|uniref:Transcriptional regulator, GntR family n=1 Tax=Actinosynnema mirum (strain ATCC 29888 / DSM 43827 / JCM 3225 / NBRC 14064 / NCIMB 13271 / NRRL B-12336 / IMRU 3971 / 101) TaxID=446462 RepID=C6WQN9_ACTMD|nr:GntR family transcriptional regulator [Actinosynnema mirum]ACU38729.1 transcriptional regulator, GntR family [Actinosynnema mirum DSM 43827]